MHILRQKQFIYLKYYLRTFTTVTHRVLFVDNPTNRYIFINSNKIRDACWLYVFKRFEKCKKLKKLGLILADFCLLKRLITFGKLTVTHILYLFDLIGFVYYLGTQILI